MWLFCYLCGLIALALVEIPPAEGGPPRVSDTDRLEEQKPQRKDAYGDALPAGAVLRLGTVRLRHGGGIPGLAFTPDDKVLASASYDGKVRLWDVATGNLLHRLGGHDPYPTSLAVSPDGKVVAAGGSPNTIILWDRATGRELRRIKAFAYPNLMVPAIAFAPDGQTLAATGDNDVTIRLFAVATGEEIRRLAGHGRVVNRVAFAPDGRSLAAAGFGKEILLWDVRTGKELRRFLGHQGNAHTAVAFSPDGRTLATAGDHHDGTIRLWDVAGGQELRRFEGKHQYLPPVFAWAPDGKTLVTSGPDRTIHVWDAATWNELRRIEDCRDLLTSVAFGHDSRTLAAACRNILRLWDVTTGKERLPFTAHGSGVATVAFSADGKLLASGSWDKTARLWDAATGKELRRLDHRHGVWSVAFSAAGQLLAASGGRVHTWDPATGKELGAGGRDVGALSPSGRFMAASVSPDRTLRLWEAATGKERPSPAVRSVDRLAFSADGELLALITAEGWSQTVLVVLEVATGKTRRRVDLSALFPAGDREHGPDIKAMVFSPDRTALALVPRRDDIRLVELATGRERLRLAVQRVDQELHHAAISPDDRLLVAGGPGHRANHPIRLWDLTTGKELPSLLGHDDYASFAFAPDGRRLASASGDGTVLVWDVSRLGR